VGAGLDRGLGVGLGFELTEELADVVGLDLMFGLLLVNSY
jgi:hypothetical protein